jgi:hypothetical protein
MTKITDKERNIYKTIKLIRDSFYESVAIYTHWRCFHFAQILKHIYQWELYHDENKGHVVTKINGEYYDIRWNLANIYNDLYLLDEFKKLTEYQILNWDWNRHSANTDTLMLKYQEYLKDL